MKPTEHLCWQLAGIIVTCYHYHPTGTGFVLLSEGCSSLGAPPALLALSRAFGAELVPPCCSRCHVGESQPIGSMGRARLCPCDVQVPIQESFPHPPAKPQIPCLYLGGFEVALPLRAVPGKMGKVLGLFLPFLLHDPKSSSKCGFVGLSFSCLSYHQGLWKWRTGGITAPMSLP